MATAALGTPWRTAWAATTTQQFIRAAQWTMALLALGCAIYAIEKYGLRLDKRFMESPADVIVRAFGMAHILVGALFLFSSSRLREVRSLARLAICTLLGIGLCLAFSYFGALKNPLLLMSFYGLFFVHEIRDETMLFRTYGDAPTGQAVDALLALMSRAAVLCFVTLLVGLYLAYAIGGTKASALKNASLWPAVGILAALSGLSTWSTIRAWKSGVGLHGDGMAFWLAYRPLFGVYASLLGILLIGGAFFGSTGLNLIVLTHATSWLVFVRYQLRNRGQPRDGNVWTWLRGTPQGFLTLHLGVFLLLLGLMAVRVYVWQRVGMVSVLLSGSNFCYWTLMHVAMSFWSKR